jgi:hypothetical protein
LVKIQAAVGMAILKKHYNIQQAMQNKAAFWVVFMITNLKILLAAKDD